MKIFSNLVEQSALESQISISDENNINKIKQAMKREYKKLWHSFMWNDTIFIDRSISVASDSQEIILPSDVESIFYLTEHSLQRVLKPTHINIFSLDNIADIGSNLSPWKYTNAGYIGLPSKTTTATKIWVTSSSSLDSINIRVHGKESTNNNRSSDLIAVNGTSLIEGAIEFSAGEIDSISKSSLTVGTLTIKDDDGNVLDTIPPRSYGNSYKVLKLTTTTDQAYTLYATGKLKFKDIEYNEDPVLFNCGDALVLYGQAKIFQDRGEIQLSSERKAEAASVVQSLLEEKFIKSTNQEDTNPIMYRNEMDIAVLSGGFS